MRLGLCCEWSRECTGQMVVWGSFEEVRREKKYLRNLRLFPHHLSWLSRGPILNTIRKNSHHVTSSFSKASILLQSLSCLSSNPYSLSAPCASFVSLCSLCSLAHLLSSLQHLMQTSHTECQESTWTSQKVTCPFRKHICVATCFGRPTGLQIAKSLAMSPILSNSRGAPTYQWCFIAGRLFPLFLPIL